MEEGRRGREKEGGVKIYVCAIKHQNRGKQHKGWQDKYNKMEGGRKERMKQTNKQSEMERKKEIKERKDN